MSTKVRCKRCRCYRSTNEFVSKTGRSLKTCLHCRTHVKNCRLRKKQKERDAQPTVLPDVLNDIILSYCFEQLCELDCKGNNYRFFQVTPNLSCTNSSWLMCGNCLQALSHVKNCQVHEWVPPILPDYTPEDEYYEFREYPSA